MLLLIAWNRFSKTSIMIGKFELFRTHKFCSYQNCSMFVLILILDGRNIKPNWHFSCAYLCRKQHWSLVCSQAKNLTILWCLRKWLAHLTEAFLLDEAWFPDLSINCPDFNFETRIQPWFSSCSDYGKRYFWGFPIGFVLFNHFM